MAGSVEHPTTPGRATVLAIDGPGGAGKSTVASLLASRLGVRRLDTGAIYRAVTVAVMRAGVDPRDPSGCAAVAEQAVVRFEDDRVLLDGADVTCDIRTPEVTAEVSSVSAHPDVRRALVAEQRAAAAGGTWIVEGRDIGTVVFPDAELKVYLTASPAVRASRRASELGETDVAAVESEIRRRDHEDSTRPDSPLKAASDAVTVDTTELTTDEVVDRIEMVWLQRGTMGDRSGTETA